MQTSEKLCSHMQAASCSTRLGLSLFSLCAQGNRWHQPSPSIVSQEVIEHIGVPFSSLEYHQECVSAKCGKGNSERDPAWNLLCKSEGACL